MILSVVSIGCGPTTTGQISTAVQESTKSSVQSTSVPTNIPEKPASTSTQKPTTPPKPTATPKPTTVPTKAPKALNIIDQPFFYQDDQSLTVVFLIENPNEGHTVENSQYQLIASDEAGTVLKTNSGYVELILPNEKLAVVSNTYLEKGQKAGKIEVQLKSGKSQASDLKSPLFQSDNITYYADQYFPKVTGVLTNSLTRSFSNLRVTAVLYDQSNNIIGGGYTF